MRTWPARLRIEQIALFLSGVTTLTPVTPEEAVRLYLTWIAEPTKLVDAGEVKKLEADVAKAKDPVDKLRAIAALDRARNVDGSSYRSDFVLHAKAWAEAEGVPAQAFRELGVGEDALVEAGFAPIGGRRRGGRPGRAPKAGARKRAPKVSIEEIQQWVLTQSEPFTTSTIADKLGGSPATVKKALDGLIAANKLQNLGPMREYTGRGRAPYKYSTKVESTGGGRRKTVAAR